MDSVIARPQSGRGNPDFLSSSPKRLDRFVAALFPITVFWVSGRDVFSGCGGIMELIYYEIKMISRFLPNSRVCFHK